MRRRKPGIDKRHGGGVDDLRWILTSGRGRAVPRWARASVRSFAVESRYRGLSDHDLLLAGFPKAGSTWLRFVLLELFTGNSPGTFEDVNMTSPDVGSHAGAPLIVEGDGRLVKTHEPCRAVQGASPKALCIVRDPRDVAVSMFHYLRRRQSDGAELSLERFVRSFAQGRVLPYGAWDTHTASWLDAAHDHPARVAVVKYEDLLQDGTGALAPRLVELGYSFPLEAVRAALGNNSATQMRAKERSSSASAFLTGSGENSPSIPFVRAAKSGQWRSALPEALSDLLSSEFRDVIERLGYPTH